MLSWLNLLTASFKMNVRNKQALVWTFVMPVVLMVLFGLAFGKSETISLKVGLVDEANNRFSRDFARGLKKNDALKVTTGGRDDELRALKSGDRSMVIILPKGFGSSALALMEAKKKAEAAAKAAAEAAAKGAAEPGASKRDATQAPAQVPERGQIPGSGGIIPAPGASASYAPLPKLKASELEAYYDKTNPSLFGTSKSLINQLVLGMNQKAAGSPELFKIIEKQVSSKKYSNIDFFAAGILAMFIMNGGAVAVVMILVGYREKGILRRLMATPMSIASFISSQIIIRVIIALLQMALLLGIAVWVFGAHVMGSPLLLSAIVVEGALVFIALGFAIASFANSDQTAMAVANVITMPMMFLSGVFFPTDTFPKFIQPLIKVLPLTYLARALREVMMRGSGFDAVAKDMGILAIFGIAIFLVSVRAFRWE